MVVGCGFGIVLTVCNKFVPNNKGYEILTW
jgi:hypothetical protein